jgi:hypothetical protein
MALGIIVGAGSFSIAKSLINRPSKSKKEKQEEAKAREIEQQLKSKLNGIQEQFLEKHNQRLMELVAQR